MNLKQGQPVVQVVASPSRAPFDKLAQHRGYPFAGTIEEKPEEAEYWLEHITQIITEQLSRSDEHKLECVVALLVDEALSWWETTTLTTPTEKVTWEFFVEEFKKKYIREQHFDARKKKFLYLKQGSEPIGQYAKCLNPALLRLKIPEAPLLKKIVSGWKKFFLRQDKPQTPVQPQEPIQSQNPVQPPEPAQAPQNPFDVQTIQRECLLSMKEMFDQFSMNLKQGQPVVQVVASPSRAPIDKLAQHRGYPFAGTIEEKPEEAEYWLEHITQIITEQLSRSDEHKLECVVALLVDEALSWWETTTLTTPTEKVTWEFFVEEFKKKYIREQHFDARKKKFLYLKQGSEPIGQYARQPVVQVVASPSRAPIDKLAQHRGYPFAGTIEEKPEEAEYWLEHITQIITEQLSRSDEHKLECVVALLVDEALSWWETTTLTTPTEKVTWEFFVEEFKKKYIREQHFNARKKKFLYLKQGSEPIGQYAKGPVQILDREIKILRNKSVPLVKVLWKNHGVEEVTREKEATMQEQYPHLFDFGKNRN
ncbi:hypothetical protein GQ457_13G016100 [Hibiscus cannabinus]